MNEGNGEIKREIDGLSTTSAAAATRALAGPHDLPTTHARTHAHAVSLEPSQPVSQDTGPAPTICGGERRGFEGWTAAAAAGCLSGT
jgi:hypothetical protein